MENLPNSQFNTLGDAINHALSLIPEEIKRQHFNDEIWKKIKACSDVKLSEINKNKIGSGRFQLPVKDTLAAYLVNIICPELIRSSLDPVKLQRIEPDKNAMKDAENIVKFVREKLGIEVVEDSKLGKFNVRLFKHIPDVAV